MNRNLACLWLVGLLFPWLDSSLANAQSTILIKPAQVFDGVSDQTHEGWAVLIRDNLIVKVGPADQITAPEGCRTVDLPKSTLTPGLIDAHTHVLLHPYNEASWNDQVLKEPLALRVSRANNHLRAILQSGFTTIRDLGTEGAGYSDVGLKQAVEQNLIPGPRMFVVTRAIVATGSYGPKGFAPEFFIPQGAEETDGDDVIRVTRDQIGKGADWIKIYADAAMGGQEVRPSFTLAEMKKMVETADALGIPVTVHATSKLGMQNAALAGATTIEHGDGGDPEVFQLMAARKIALCPTLGATEAMAIYNEKWKPGQPEPASIQSKRAMFKHALKANVTIVNGSDLGVFAHGQGARELELLVDYGMKPVDALRSATSVAAKTLKQDRTLGTIEAGKIADLAAFEGNPLDQIKALRKVTLVVKNGKLISPGSTSSSPMPGGDLDIP